jgi:hypothetical protein
VTSSAVRWRTASPPAAGAVRLAEATEPPPVSPPSTTAQRRATRTRSSPPASVGRSAPAPGASARSMSANASLRPARRRVPARAATTSRDSRATPCAPATVEAAATHSAAAAPRRRALTGRPPARA